MVLWRKSLKISNNIYGFVTDIDDGDKIETGEIVMGTKENNLINIVVKVGGYYTVPLKDQFGNVLSGNEIKRFINKVKETYLEKYSNITIFPEDWKAHLEEDEFSVYVQHLVHFNKIESDKVKETIDNFLKDNFLELKKREFDWMTKPSFAYAYLKNKEK